MYYLLLLFVALDLNGFDSRQLSHEPGGIGEKKYGLFVRWRRPVTVLCVLKLERVQALRIELAKN